MPGKPPSPLNSYLQRTKHLSQLYDFSMHSYDLAAESLRESVKKGELNVDSQVRSRHGFVPQHHVNKVLGQSQYGFPRDLRVVVLSRLVSDLELFLVAQIRAVTARTNTIFREDLPLDWPRGRLRSFDTLDELRATLVETDCRSLTSGGFDEICKFYKKHLDISVNSPAIRLDTLREIHARRHLHVHRGGVADATYAKDFGASARIGQFLPVDDPYLRAAFDLFRATVRHVATECDRLHPRVQATIKPGNARTMTADDSIYFVTATFRDPPSLEAYFEPTRPLRSRNRISTILLFDMLVRAQYIKARAEWTIIGHGDPLTQFFVDLDFHEKIETLTKVSYRRS